MGGQDHDSDGVQLDAIDMAYQHLDVDVRGAALVDLDGFLATLADLMKLFNLFGVAFGFVVDDVTKKIAEVRRIRATYDAEITQTCQDLVCYEKEQGTLNTNPKTSASRHLLRLVRAVEFVGRFFTEVDERDERTEPSAIASTAYNATLANHHSWILRKTVGAAMYGLPYRSKLLVLLKTTETDFKMISERLAKRLNHIATTLMTFYDDQGLSQLP